MVVSLLDAVWASLARKSTAHALMRNWVREEWEGLKDLRKGKAAVVSPIFGPLEQEILDSMSMPPHPSFTPCHTNSAAQRTSSSAHNTGRQNRHRTKGRVEPLCPPQFGPTT